MTVNPNKSVPSKRIEAIDEAVISSENTGFITVEEVIRNVNQTVVITTEDKLKICLNDHIKGVERSRDWVAPLSLLLSLLLTLVTTDFRDFLLPKETWGALFILFAIISFIWLVFTIKQALNKPGLGQLINNIKGKQ